MKRFLHTIAASIALMLGSMGFASEAETSATAGSDRWGNASAGATARYEGDVGFARTQTRTGSVSLARGVALGVDEDGLSFSLSHAVGNQRGTSVASNFNMSIGNDGGVAVSRGRTVSTGPIHRSATAGGSTTTGYRRPVAASVASGSSDRYGTVRTRTQAKTYRPRSVVRKHYRR